MAMLGIKLCVSPSCTCDTVSVFLRKRLFQSLTILEVWSPVRGTKRKMDVETVLLSCCAEDR